VIHPAARKCTAPGLHRVLHDRAAAVQNGAVV